MVTKVREAPSVEKEIITRENVLRLIPQHYIDSIFLRPHLDRELVIGTVGDRGGGKSGTDAVLGLAMFMLAGKPVWSNIKIQCDIQIDNATAREHGLNSGGVAYYESLPLEKVALLKLDETYRNGCLVIEEINVQYSNVRRFMTNTNIDFNEVCQQLRKFRTSLIYNVIDEMFVDPQLRALTDIFIMTYDTAFDLDSLAAHKQTGIDFKWKVFPLSGYLAGEQNKYSITHKSLPSVFFHFEPWRGVYDSMRHQEKGTYSLNKREKEAALKAQFSTEYSEDLEKDKAEYDKKWAELDGAIINMSRNGTKEIERYLLYDELGIEPSMEDEADRHLRKACHLHIRWSNGQKYYIFPQRLFDDKKRENAAVQTV